MPIRGMSDRDSVDPRFREIGRIRKGGPKRKHQKRNGQVVEIFGEDLDYFRFVPDSKYPDAAQAFEAAYGKEPRKLTVFFPFQQMEQNFSSWREAYGQNRLCKLRCDGAGWRDWVMDGRHYHSKDGRECDLEFRDSENGCPNCPCVHVGRLSVILEDMWLAGFIGLITVITYSKNDIASLAAKLVQWEPLTGRPFSLWREVERIGAPINGRRARIEKNLLHLELTEERLQLEFNAAQERSRAQLMAPQPAAQGNYTPSDDPYEEDDTFPDDDELLAVESLPFDQEPIEEDGFLGVPMDAGDREDYREIQEDEAAEIDHAAQVAEAQREIVDLEGLDLTYVPDWIDDDEARPGMWWGKFDHEAVQHLGFKNDFHVHGALENIYKLEPKTWNEHKTEHAYRESWHLLQEHQRSKLPESEEAS